MSNLFKGLLPWLALMVAGPIAVQFFLRVNMEHRKQRRGDLKFLGSDANPSIEKLYKEMVEDQDLDKWENVRGPRPEEDNSEFETNRARRRAEMEAKQKMYRAKREEIKRRLEEHQQK